jgi:hypothetical protein
LTIWGDNEQHAVAIAQEWLDQTEKLGIDPRAEATVERIGDAPHLDDIIEGRHLGPRELRARLTVGEKINWARWLVCLVRGHSYEHLRPYLLQCQRCGRQEPLRPPDE